jgi:beta propeller repeat protein
MFSEGLMKYFYNFFFAFAVFFCLSSAAYAADTACAKVVMDIPLELTIERVAFDAKLVLTNNLFEIPLEDIRVDVEIADADGVRKDEIFFISKPTTSNVNAVDGTGIVEPQTRAEVHWLIIPSPGSGGETPDGIYYFVGATLSYTVSGLEQTIPIYPDRITVKPMPQLYLDYFTPFRVYGDNPFTTEAEPPVPYELAVRVLNDGFGPANSLKIASAQPIIRENNQGLLVDFQLLGASVKDSPVSPTLTVDMGTVSAKSGSTAYWKMISSLSGRIEEFDVTFSHASELGGELTSLLRETNPHYLVHRIKATQPGRDSLLDFLADSTTDDDELPDSIFESEYPDGTTELTAAQSPVTVVSFVSPPASPTPESPSVMIQLDLSTNPDGWVYASTDDPSQGLVKLVDVIRSDGMHLDPNNFWTDTGLDKDYQPIHTLQFVDFRGIPATAPDTYRLVFTAQEKDETAPVTTLVFDGPSVGNDPVYLTPATRVVFTAQDNDGGSGVEHMYRKLLSLEDGFSEALPFSIDTVGISTLVYYSVDKSGNLEEERTATLIVDDAAPVVTGFKVEPDIFSPGAPLGVNADSSTEIVLTAIDEMSSLSVTVEILNAETILRSLKAEAVSGSELSINWDGMDASGAPVAEGIYTIRVSVSDGLGNSIYPDAPSHSTVVEASVTAINWFAETAIDPVAGKQQMFPALSGSQVVWQDNRNGNWDIYYKGVADSVTASQRITAGAADQAHPDIDGSTIVWQDYRNGDWDIYGYDLNHGQEFVVYVDDYDSFDQTIPVVSGDWVAWQENRNGILNIYAKNLTSGDLIQVTDHERKQEHPAISGSMLLWEDYRHGPAEIYSYDLFTGTEKRLTYDSASQLQPAVSGNVIVWSDQRDGVQALYRYSEEGDSRLTYGAGSHRQASLAGGLLVYSNFTVTDSSDLAYFDLAGQHGGVLISNAARQEEPAAGEGYVVWQDDRDGTWQIYLSPLEVTPLPIEVSLQPGFNLVAVGQKLIDSYSTASALTVPNGNGPIIDKAMSYNAQQSGFFAAELAGGDFALQPGAGLILYAQEAGTLQVGDYGERRSYTLQVGTNHIGLLSLPFGYRAHDLLNSVGLENVQSVRRFDNETGRWRTAAVRDHDGAKEIVGENFVIRAGDGLVVTMKQKVDVWKP